LFANALDLSRTMLVIAPHPDDAEIAAFGVYAHRHATVASVTTGNAGPRRHRPVSHLQPRVAAAAEADRPGIDARSSRLSVAPLPDDHRRRPRRRTGKEDPSGGVSYLRRGPRSNELFFVYDRRSMTTVVDAFLAGWNSRAAP
jgi:hypothetical protein